MSVKEIAATLGYDDPFYFSRIFKSVNHVAPSEYRLLKNGAKEEVRNCGITLRFFYPRESQAGLEQATSHPAQQRAGAKNGTGVGSLEIAGYRNGEKC
jgi:AraC-like DNA-binding protein